MVRAGFEPALTVGACHPPITPLGLSRSPSGPTCSHHAAEPCMVGQFRVPCFLDIRFRAGNCPGWTRTSTFRLVASRLHSATGPNAALSPPVTHTLVGPTPLVRFAGPSLLEQDRRFTDCGTKAVPIAALRFNQPSETIRPRPRKPNRTHPAAGCPSWG